MYDVLIIGCGVIGSAMAYTLSRYQLKVCVCERFNDVANGVTKANSAILHAGFDCPPGSLDEEGFADCHANAYYKVVEELAAKEGAQVIPVCAKLEAEIAELDGEEKKMFLDDLGIAESGLDRLIKASYALLGLISFLTSGEDECRAWTIKRGTKAPQAAGKIHTDFERGFIRAEVVNFDDLMACGSMNAAKEKGLVRSEGKEYVMKDGDIVLFRFNV